MSTTFTTHLATIKWLKWEHRIREGVIHVRIDAFGESVEYDLPAEMIVTRNGQTRFMQIAFGHWRRLRARHETAERVKQELLK